MLAAGELAGAVGYQSRWLVLAVCLLVAAVAWNAGVALWGRPRRSRTTRPKPPVDVPGLVRRYLGLVDRVEQDHLAGRLDSRAAHQRLSALVRAFVEEVDDVPATAMTLTRLRAERRADLDGLLGVVESTYPPAFGVDTAEIADVRDAVARAREVVASWR